MCRSWMRALILLLAACGDDAGDGSHSDSGVIDSNAIDSGMIVTTQEPAWAIAIDDTSVYWTTLGANGAIMKSPKVGGAAITLAATPGKALSIALDATTVYWTNRDAGTVMKIDKGGGTPVQLASGQASPAGIAVDSTHVYWVTNTNSGDVMRMPISGGTPQSIAGFELQPVLIELDATSMYWLNHYDGAVKTMPLVLSSSGPSTLAFESGSYPYGLAVSDSMVFWTTRGTGLGQGTVRAVPKAGGERTELAMGLDAPCALAMAADTLYVLTSAADASVIKLPVSGGTPTVIATGHTTARELAVDDSFVYWTTEQPGGVHRAAR